jgi:DNA-binding XRE family transcriptional regulator
VNRKSANSGAADVCSRAGEPAAVMASNVVPLVTRARRLAAARVRRARTALGLTQAEAAALAGISERSYRDIELGRVRMAALEALVILEGGIHAPAPVKAGPVSLVSAHGAAAGLRLQLVEHLCCATEPGTIPTALGVCIDGRGTDSMGTRVCNALPRVRTSATDQHDRLIAGSRPATGTKEAA